MQAADSESDERSCSSSSEEDDDDGSGDDWQPSEQCADLSVDERATLAIAGGRRIHGDEENLPQPPCSSVTSADERTFVPRMQEPRAGVQGGSTKFLRKVCLSPGMWDVCICCRYNVPNLAGCMCGAHAAGAIRTVWFALVIGVQCVVDVSYVPGMQISAGFSHARRVCSAGGEPWRAQGAKGEPAASHTLQRCVEQCMAVIDAVWHFCRGSYEYCVEKAYQGLQQFVKSRRVYRDGGCCHLPCQLLQGSWQHSVLHSSAFAMLESASCVLTR